MYVRYIHIVWSVEEWSNDACTCTQHVRTFHMCLNHNVHLSSNFVCCLCSSTWWYVLFFDCLLFPHLEQAYTPGTRKRLAHLRALASMVQGRDNSSQVLSVCIFPICMHLCMLCMHSLYASMYALYCLHCLHCLHCLYASMYALSAPMSAPMSASTSHAHAVTDRRSLCSHIQVTDKRSLCLQIFLHS